MIHEHKYSDQWYRPQSLSVSPWYSTQWF